MTWELVTDLTLLLGWVLLWAEVGGLRNRLTRAEQALETSVRAHERHGLRHVELCDRMGRSEKLSRERSRRIRTRVRRSEIRDGSADPKAQMAATYRLVTKEAS